MIFVQTSKTECTFGGEDRIFFCRNYLGTVHRSSVYHTNLERLM